MLGQMGVSELGNGATQIPDLDQVDLLPAEHAEGILELAHHGLIAGATDIQLGRQKDIVADAQVLDGFTNEGFRPAIRWRRVDHLPAKVAEKLEHLTGWLPLRTLGREVEGLGRSEPNDRELLAGGRNRLSDGRKLLRDRFRVRSERLPGQ